MRCIFLALLACSLLRDDRQSRHRRPFCILCILIIVYAIVYNVNIMKYYEILRLCVLLACQRNAMYCNAKLCDVALHFFIFHDVLVSSNGDAFHKTKTIYLEKAAP